MIETALAYLVGLVVGIIIGLLGGGGALLLPAMLYLLHLDLKLATAYTTILVGTTALFGAIPRIKAKRVDWPTVLALGIPVSMGMLLVRLWLFGAIPDRLFGIGSFDVTKKMFVLTLFACLLILSFATMAGLVGRSFESKKNLQSDSPFAYYAILTICGLLIGILPGFTGAGGGVLIVPLLVVVFGLHIKTVVGTSLSIIAIKSFVGFCGGDAIRLGSEIDYWFLLRFSLLMIVGVLAGSTLSHRIDARKLKLIFAWFLLALAVFMIVNEVLFKIPQ